MPNWLDLLPREVELADFKPGDPLEPTWDVGEKDHPVGVLGDDLKRMYILAVRQKQEAAQVAVEAQFSMNQQERDRLTSKAVELKEKGEILQRIFWAAVKDQFKLWDKESIGLRSGWTAVWSDVDVPPILGMLGEFFSGND